MGYGSNFLGQLIGLWLFVAMFAAVIGGRGMASKVLAVPFRFGGWVLRGVLGSAGQGARTVVTTLWRGFVRLVSDAHSHCYGHWPGATLLGYVVIFVTAGVLIYLW